MQQLLEFLPVVFFFLAYFSEKVITLGSWHFALGGMHAATIVLIAAMVLQLIITYLLYKKIEKRHWVIFAIVVIFGSMTLYFHNSLFIQWKPTIINWLFAGAFIVAPYFTRGEPLVKKVAGSKISMPDSIWSRLTTFLIAYFFLIGALNLFVVYNFSEPTWIKFKLWSSPVASLFMSAVIIYLVYPYLDPKILETNSKKSAEPNTVLTNKSELKSDSTDDLNNKVNS